MRTWMAALTLSLCAVHVQAQEKLKMLPTEDSMANPPATAHPVAATGSCGQECHAGCGSCSRGNNFLAWLTYCPSTSNCCLIPERGPRQPLLYAYFMTHPCNEACAPACGKPAGNSCSGGCCHRQLGEWFSNLLDW